MTSLHRPQTTLNRFVCVYVSNESKRRNLKHSISLLRLGLILRFAQSGSAFEKKGKKKPVISLKMTHLCLFISPLCVVALPCEAFCLTRVSRSSLKARVHMWLLLFTPPDSDHAD